MNLEGRTVALYGRFSPGARERLQRQITQGGGLVARDLTRRTDVFVVGALATALIDTGVLAGRLHTARERGLPIRGEAAFAAELAGDQADVGATLPLSTALAGATLTPDDAEILAAFDLIALADGCCRFGDASVIRSAAALVDQGRSRGEVVRILMRARDLAPKGVHKIVLTASGEAALQWEDGLTTLEGQGVLPLDATSLEDLFEAAAIAQADGDGDEAARLYDLCARADRQDALAPYNYANIRMAQGAFDDAAMAYRLALSRDKGLIEARYNLAQALEAAGKTDAATEELRQVLAADPTYLDALFNLAQLRMQAGATDEAKALYERYLALDPPAEWAATARKALTYCTAATSA